MLLLGLPSPARARQGLSSLRVLGMTPLKESPDAAAELAMVIDEGGDDEAMGATDCPHGCLVEPDGSCPHGFKSAALTLGVI